MVDRLHIQNRTTNPLAIALSEVRKEWKGEMVG
jgi:hypothetical protein